MSPRDADARLLEQFLRTMAPPAALTATYRHKVVLASLEARSRVIQRRRTCRLVVACSLCLCLIAGPILFGVLPVVSQVGAVAQTPVESPPTSVLNVPSPAADGFESALIQSQWPTRVQTWAAAQRAIAP